LARKIQDETGPALEQELTPKHGPKTEQLDQNRKPSVKSKPECMCSWPTHRLTRPNRKIGTICKSKRYSRKKTGDRHSALRFKAKGTGSTDGFGSQQETHSESDRRWINQKQAPKAETAPRKIKTEIYSSTREN
jgi:hypothetical protein